jgi:hypothetical protein
MRLETMPCMGLSLSSAISIPVHLLLLNSFVRPLDHVSGGQRL